MFAVHLEKTSGPVAATGISLSPADLGYSVFGITAVLLTVLLVYSAWKSQRTLSAGI